MTESESTAEQVAAAVRAHPAVARLHDGGFGAIASYLPGRRVTGVRLGESGEPAQVGVVLRLAEPLPHVVAQLRERVAAVLGPGPVDITVADVVDAADPEPAADGRGG